MEKAKHNIAADPKKDTAGALLPASITSPLCDANKDLPAKPQIVAKIEGETRNFEQNYIISHNKSPPFLTTTSKLLPKFNGGCVYVDDTLYEFWRRKKERELALTPTRYEQIHESLEEISEQFFVIVGYIEYKIRRIAKKIRILIKIDKYAGENARDRVIIFKKNQKISKYSRMLRVLLCHLDANVIDPFARGLSALLGFVMCGVFFLAFPIVAFCGQIFCRTYTSLTGCKVRPALQRRKGAVKRTLDDGYSTRLNKKNYAAQITSKAFHFVPLTFHEFISQCHSYYCMAEAVWTGQVTPYAKIRALELEKEAIKRRRDYLAVYYVFFRRQIALAGQRRQDEKYESRLDLRERRRLVAVGTTAVKESKPKKKGWFEKRENKQEKEVKTELEARLCQYSLSYATEMPPKRRPMPKISKRVFAPAVCLARTLGGKIVGLLARYEATSEMANSVRQLMPEPHQPSEREQRDEMHNLILKQIEHEYREFIQNKERDEELQKRKVAMKRLTTLKSSIARSRADHDDDGQPDSSMRTTAKPSSPRTLSSFIPFYSLFSSRKEETHSDNCASATVYTFDKLPRTPGTGPQTIAARAVVTLVGRSVSEKVRIRKDRGLELLASRVEGNDGVRHRMRNDELNLRHTMRTNVVIIYENPNIDIARLMDADIPIAVTLSDQYQNALLVQRMMEIGDAAIVTLALAAEAVDIAIAADDDVSKNNKVRERDEKYKHKIEAHILKRWEQQRRDLDRFAWEEQELAIKTEANHAKAAVRAERKWREKIQNEEIEARVRERFEADLGEGKPATTLKKQLKIEKAQAKADREERQKKAEHLEKVRHRVEKKKSKRGSSGVLGRLGFDPRSIFGKTKSKTDDPDDHQARQNDFLSPTFFAAGSKGSADGSDYDGFSQDDSLSSDLSDIEDFDDGFDRINPRSASKKSSGTGWKHNVVSAVTFPINLAAKGARKLLPHHANDEGEGRDVLSPNTLRAAGDTNDYSRNIGSWSSQQSIGTLSSNDDDKIYDDFFNFNVDDVCDRDQNSSRTTLFSSPSMSVFSGDGSPTLSLIGGSQASPLIPIDMNDGNTTLRGRQRRHVDKKFELFFSKDNIPHFGFFGLRFFDRRKEREEHRQKRKKDKVSSAQPHNEIKEYIAPSHLDSQTLDNVPLHQRNEMPLLRRSVRIAENAINAKGHRQRESKPKAEQLTSEIKVKNQPRFSNLLRKLVPWHWKGSEIVQSGDPSASTHTSTTAPMSTADPHEPFMNPNPSVLQFYSHGQATFFPSVKLSTFNRNIQSKQNTDALKEESVQSASKRNTS